jgi:hypothetical protein
MNWKGIVFGFFLSLFPVFILFKIFKGRFLFVSNPYMKGALMGFVLWLICALLFYIDAVSGAIGILRSESGPALFALLTSSIQGFITAGIVVGAFSKKF